jgi:hypothetical protein
MKTIPSVITIVCLSAFCTPVLAAEGIVTLTCKGPSVTNEIQITAQQTAKLRTWLDSSNMNGNSTATRLEIQKDGKAFMPPLFMFNSPQNVRGYTPDFIFAGPATVRFISESWAQPDSVGLLSLDIQPSPFPPSRAVTVGAYSGNVRVTMEMSTDLVNWTASVNGMLYTNSPDARFFRISLETNASP